MFQNWVFTLVSIEGENRLIIAHSPLIKNFLLLTSRKFKVLSMKNKKNHKLLQINLNSPKLGCINKEASEESRRKKRRKDKMRCLSFYSFFFLLSVCMVWLLCSNFSCDIRFGNFLKRLFPPILGNFFAIHSIHSE